MRISQYKGSTFVDIREMYEKDGEERPGKKGGIYASLGVDMFVSIACIVRSLLAIYSSN